MICPKCGKNTVCRDCGYSEPPDLWMKSHHDFETEIALADNVQEQMPELWNVLDSLGATMHKTTIHHGMMVYKLTKPTPNAPSGRVVRIPVAIWNVRGGKFTRPKNYTERRDSDTKSLAAWKSSHRIKENKV